MKAAMCRRFGGPEVIAIEDIDEPEAGEGEVLLRVEAAALNFFDTLMIRNKYQFKPPMPFSPAAEVAGVVEATGPAATGVKPGDRVLANVRWNGAREKTVAAASSLTPIPDGVPFEVAAGLTITYGTAMHGLSDRARVRAGDTVAVLGASGGAGLAAVEIAALMGARVIACASSQDKLALCRAHGAHETINYTEEDLKQRLRDLTDGAGADVVYDCVGGPFAEPAFRSTAWEGRYLVVGFAAGEIPKMPLNLALLKGASLMGVFWGEFVRRNPEKNSANIAQVVDWVAGGKLKPHVHKVYPLSQTREALEAIDRREAKGKVVIAPQMK
ncbi:MAG: NADPH:quinone oxidoreductase family protein [Hyphomicrobiales bacterium]